jgi:hypothetical protein
MWDKHNQIDFLNKILISLNNSEACPFQNYTVNIVFLVYMCKYINLFLIVQIKNPSRYLRRGVLKQSYGVV